MSNDIEQLKTERKTIMEMLEIKQDYEMGKRLQTINYLLNQNNSGLYYRGYTEYTECMPRLVGEKFRKQIENGDYVCAFFSSYSYLDEQSVINLSAITPYDYENIEHKMMMQEKRVVRLTINPHAVKHDCERVDISAHLSFSYYIEGNLREIDLDIYVRDGYKWATSGVNWSAMGTTETNIVIIYAEMMRVACEIHNSLHSTAMSIKNTKPSA